MLNSLAYNLQTCFLNLFLNKGIMFASFHSKGTIPSCSDMLNTFASGVLICSTVSFSILGDIPSTPGDLFSFILLILLATSLLMGLQLTASTYHPLIPWTLFLVQVTNVYTSDFWHRDWRRRPTPKPLSRRLSAEVEHVPMIAKKWHRYLRGSHSAPSRWSPPDLLSC